MNILRRRITDNDTLWLLRQIIDSFCIDGRNDVGLPLGNLTSQLFVNVYMNEFDQFIKRKLKAQYYIRYADDFVILHSDREYVEKVLPEVAAFLKTKLRLSLHPRKITIKTIASGVDFLGWVHFPDHRVLRKGTKRRMRRKLKDNVSDETIASYKGLLSHGNTYKLRERLQS